MSNKNEVNNKIEIETLVQKIIDVQEDKEHLMERELLTSKMMRQLYKELGEPNIKDYPDIYNHISCANRVSGWTKYPTILTKSYMNMENGCIYNKLKKMSAIKEGIVDSYNRDGWSATVMAFNVMCEKYVPHKDYDNVWIRFTSSRDTSKYEYVLVKGD